MGAREHLARGDVLRGQGRTEDALREYERAIAVDPKSVLAHVMRGLCMADLGQNRKGLDAVRDGLRCDPECAFAHRIRGLILYRIGVFKESREAVDNALEIDPWDPYNYYMVAHLEEAQKRLPSALEWVDKALALAPDDTELLVTRARILSSLGRKKEALQVSDEALRADPDEADAHVGMGHAQLANRDYKGALDTFQNALRMSPNLRPARQGMLEAMRGKFIFYRWLQSYIEFTDRLKVGRIIGTVLLLLAWNGLSHLVKTQPAWAPGAWTIAVLLGVVVGLIWLSRVITNFALAFHPVGRYALSKHVRAACKWLLAHMAFVAVACGIAAFGHGKWGFLFPESIGFFVICAAISNDDWMEEHQAGTIVDAIAGICLLLGILLLFTSTSKPLSATNLAAWGQLI